MARRRMARPVTALAADARQARPVRSDASVSTTGKHKPTSGSSWTVTGISGACRWCAGLLGAPEAMLHHHPCFSPAPSNSTSLAHARAAQRACCLSPRGAHPEPRQCPASISRLMYLHSHTHTHTHRTTRRATPKGVQALATH